MTGEHPEYLARMAAERAERFDLAARRAIQRTVGVHGDLLSARAVFVFLHGLDSGAIWDTALADAREDERPHPNPTRGGGTMSMVINRDLAQKVLSIVDAGLVNGMGSPEPGKMCVEAAVCYALGEKHSDRPSCVGAAVRAFKIRLNDARWSSNAARTAGMRELAIAQLGSDTLNQTEFAQRLAVATVRDLLAHVCRMRNRDDLAKECAAVTTHGEARAVALRVRGALRADAAAAAAAYAYADAAYAYAAADAAAAYAYADAAYAYAAADAAAAYAAAYAAAADAADAAAYAKRDEILRFAARMGAQVLMDMQSPGCAFLDLLDAPAAVAP